ncbi:FAD-binding domain-containing protein [Hypoxylon crocopeplum]|nr:FAD-binding domain-containing protein [Hypoxylon crocopeplum]
MKSRLSISLFALVCATSQAQRDEEWATLNASVNGRLHSTTPLALPCFSSYNGNPVAFDDAGCSLIRDNYTTDSIRAASPGGYMNSQSEICLGEPLDQCLLDGTAVPALQPSPNTSCNQGSVPSYYIHGQGVSDIRAAFNFSRQHSVPLIVKNSGHDYMTRNSQKGSLALWVHGLQDLTYHDDFVPEGCSQSGGRAVTAGTGASTADIMNFATQHGSMFVGGYSPDVAASGGWVLGAGHSVLSPVYGLGVDRVAQFKIVTLDGVLRVVNQCQHEDLFWALRGGGPAFGVVLEATHRVEPRMPVAVASIRLPPNTTADTSMKWIRLMVSESLNWGRQGWGGHAAGLYLTHVNPIPAIANITDKTAAQASMRNVTEFALSIGGTSVVEVLPDWIDVWNKYILPGALATAGTIRLVSSRLLPQQLFENEAGINKIMDFMSSAQQLGFDPRQLYVPVDTPFVVNNSSNSRGFASEKSVHPAWYSALWHVTLSTFVPWNASYEERLQNVTALTKATLLGEELTGTEGGSYLNEADPFTSDWQQSWWGANYPRLVAIKKKYDPERLLNCWKCVGFEDEDILTDRFKCQGKLQQDLYKRT